MRFAVIAAVNDQEILRNCLLASPDIDSGVEVVVQTGFGSAPAAYNSAIERVKADILVLAHQDMYFPGGWIAEVQRAIATLSNRDPDWGVLGAWGATSDDGRAGYIYWTGLEGIAGKHFEGGIQVETLDECVLVLRRSSGLLFDEHLPGFHMYGADICLEAMRRGMKNYAISAFCIHNTSEYGLLPLEFWKAFLYIRRKWKTHLPVKTTCIEVSRYCWPMIKWNLIHSINLALGRKKIHQRLPDPIQLYRSLIDS